MPDENGDKTKTASVPHGFGFIKFANGDKYRGHFKHGIADGIGEYTTKAGANGVRYRYKGSW